MAKQAKQPSIGGQAVIEGVLMKNGNKIAIAVRGPDKKIHVKKEKFVGAASKFKPAGWPFIRGSVNLVEMLIMGIHALNYSANESIGEKEEKITTWEFVGTTVIALAFAIGLFVLFPLWLTGITKTEGILFNLIDGLIRIAMFVIYVLLISLMPDVKRLFQYHGAEHKTVTCYEAGQKITLENVKKFTTVHRRCGSTFILIVLFVSILVFSLIVSDSFWVKMAGRLLLFPVIAGISYELLKLGAKFPNNFVLNIFVYPGLLLQKLTTRQPNKKQLEVAIKAFKAVE